MKSDKSGLEQYLSDRINRGHFLKNGRGQAGRGGSDGPLRPVLGQRQRRRGRGGPQIVKEADTRVNLYESGELDVGEISSEYLNRYENAPVFNAIVNFASWFLAFNQEEPVFRNENIRKGI